MIPFHADIENITQGEITLEYMNHLPKETEDIGLVLHSGGLDSLVAATIAKTKHNWILATFFDYGQRGHKIEYQAALNLARKLDLQGFAVLRHSLLKTTTELTSVSLVDASSKLPKITREDLENIEKLRTSVEAVYVPFRQACFYVSLAAFGEAICRSTKVSRVTIYAGGHATDAATFPDESSQFTYTCKQLLNIGALYGQINLELPLLHHSKHQVIERIRELEIESLIPFSCSCYDPIEITNGKPVHCGLCEACAKRKASFEVTGIRDTTLYRG